MSHSLLLWRSFVDRRKQIGLQLRQCMRPSTPLFIELCAFMAGLEEGWQLTFETRLP